MKTGIALALLCCGLVLWLPDVYVSTSATENRSYAEVPNVLPQRMTTGTSGSPDPEIKPHSDRTATYRCPPCGCRQDTALYAQPGICSRCEMPLVATNRGMAQKIDHWLVPFLQNGRLGLAYPKLIYPVFAAGIVLSLVLLFSSRRGPSLNIYLSAIILVFALYGFKNQLFGVRYGLTHNNQSIFYPLSFILLLGPLLWWYVRSTISSDFRWHRKAGWHLLPAAIAFLYYTVLSFSPETVQQHFMLSPFEVRFSHLEQLVALGLGFGYGRYSFHYFRNWQTEHSEKATMLVTWLQRFFIGVGIVFAGWSVLLLLNFWLYDLGVATVTYNPLWILIAGFLLWLSVEVAVKPRFFLVNNFSKVPAGAGTVVNDSELLDHQRKLEQHFSDYQPYLDPELNLEKLASDLDLNPRYLSMLLNQVVGKSFYEFINHYRIEEVKRLLLDPDHQHLTIEAMGKKAGFKSKSTFNAAFKKQTGMTPRAFMRQ